jgi:hypothetical protein
LGPSGRPKGEGHGCYIRSRVDERRPSFDGEKWAGPKAEDYEPVALLQAMRYLTRSEAAVLRAMIANVPHGERERIRQAGVPRSTYQAVRKRALSGGWIVERNVPTLAALGISRIAITLAQPYAEHHSEALQSLRDRRTTVLLWTSLDTLLSVAFERSTDPQTGRGDDKTLSDGMETGWLRQRWKVSVTAAEGSVPAFFDYEGAWSRAILGEPPASYPQPLEFDSAGRSGSAGPPQGSALAAFHRFLAGPMGGGDRGDSEGGRESVRQRGWDRRFRRLGWSSPRSFLVPPALPPVAGVPLSQIVFVTGRLRDPSGMSTLLPRLVQRTGIAPFLVAYDRSRIILGALSSPGLRRPARFTVLEELRTDLIEIEILRAPVQTLRTVVDFRFGRND